MDNDTIKTKILQLIEQQSDDTLELIYQILLKLTY